MPIDSLTKRASIIGLDFPANVVLPTPDGVVAQADRQGVGYKYSGLTVTTLSIPGILNDLTTIWCEDYQPVIHARHQVGLGFDDTTLIMDDQDTAETYKDDLNTAYALYISTEF